MTIDRDDINTVVMNTVSNGTVDTDDNTLVDECTMCVAKEHPRVL